MNILVIGANGRTGKHVMSAGKDSDHNMIAFKGDAMNEDNVLKQAKTADAIISVIGHGKNSPANLQTKTTENMIKAAKKYNLKIISLTGSGVRKSGDKVSLLDALLNFVISTIDKPRVRDGIEHAKILKNSAVNYSILRVLKLTNNLKKNNYSLNVHGPATVFANRKIVAKQLIELAENDYWNKQWPILS